MYQISDVTPVVLKSEDIKTVDLKCLPPGISDVPVMKQENLESLGSESFVEPQIKVEQVENSIEIKIEELRCNYETSQINSKSTAAKGGTGKVKTESADEGDNTSNLVIESVTSLNTPVTTVDHLLMMKEDVLQTPTPVKTEVDEIPVKDEFSDSKSETAILPSMEINPHTIDESTAATPASGRPWRSCVRGRPTKKDLEPDELVKELLDGKVLQPDQLELLEDLRSRMDFGDASTLSYTAQTEGPKRHLCLVCAYKTHFLSDMVKHLRYHTTEKPLACPDCEYRCVQSSSLAFHRRLHTREKPHECNFCSFRTNRSSSLTDHLRRHTGEKPFICAVCNSNFVTLHKLKIHKRAHTGEKRYACTHCDYRCATQRGLNDHTKIHLDDKNKKCPYCDYKSVRSDRLLRHIQGHTGEKPYSCTFCDYRSSEKARLVIHTRVHTGEKPYSCTFCDYRCSEKARLVIHTRVHTGEKPYSCTFCDYRSSDKALLVRHIRVHTGEKPYSCTFCDYRSSEKASLVRHIRVHTGEKRYSCTFCDYRCSEKTRLVLHTRVHTGEKPYSCASCDYRSSDKKQLVRHMRVHTNEKHYACPYCPYGASNSCTFNDIHNGIKKYKCEAEGCDYRAFTSSRLKEHLKTHMNERIRISVGPQPPAITTTLTCYSCPFETSSRQKMKSHVLQHLVPVPPETS